MEEYKLIRRQSALIKIISIAFFVMAMVVTLFDQNNAWSDSRRKHENIDKIVEKNARQMVNDGREIFRFDTFGDEAFWGDTLKLHEAIATVDPETALNVGLKVDLESLPKKLIRDLKNGNVDLTDPAVTLELLKLNAVVGVTGIFDENNQNLISMGIQCAFCHSTVDDSLAPGIGRRLDGWANRDLDVGVIISLAPNLQPIADLLSAGLGATIDVQTVINVLQSWGPGKFDAELLMDGKVFRPDGGAAATLIPPVFGLAGINLHTWTGWGSVTHWNAFVATLEMGGKGTFYDPRLNDATKFPVAAAAGFGNVRNNPDLITPKLAALQFYQLALAAPKPPEGSFDEEAAMRGRDLFQNKADCARCHVPPIFTEPGWNAHTADEIGIDDFQANRSPDEVYRTAPLGGLWTHTASGFYHDGRFPELQDVIEHYNSFFNLALTPEEKSDLEQYLLSIPTPNIENP